jgi:ATP-dependent RNA circularization protein (DNA/RNA ligase family)
MKANKIIDKNYGSIPHLSTSKMFQQADKKITSGQEKIMIEKARDYKDLIIVTEKLDGSNVGIVNINGDLKAITRSGYDAISSPYEQHRYFDLWVKKNYSKFSWLPNNFRICGEWCLQSHGTIYDITNEIPFIAFDIIDSTNNRIDYIGFIALCLKHDIKRVPILHIGQPISLKNAIKLLGKGNYGNPDRPEGIVYRVQKENKFDFIAKWVNPYKIDGQYLNETIWNKGAINHINELK